MEVKANSQRYLFLPALKSRKYRFRFLYYNVSENSITTDEAHTHDKSSLWIPLYLASDIFILDSFSKCNKCRIHAAFRKQGLATKLTFPRDMRLAEVLPTDNGSTGAWFYTVYGIIQAVVQYGKCQSEQIAVLESFMDTWKLRVGDDKLPETLSNLTPVQCNIKVMVPLPEDLKPRSSHADSSRLSLTSKTQENESEKSSCILSSGCVVSRKTAKVPKLSTSLSEIPISSKPQTGGNTNIKGSLCFETNCHPCGESSSHKLTQHSTSACAMNENNDVCSDERVHSNECDRVEGIKEDACMVAVSTTTANGKTIKRGSCWHAKGTCTTSAQCLVESDFHAKLKAEVDDLKLVFRKHSKCCLQECLYFLLEEFLRLEEDKDVERKELSASKLWNNPSLICMSRWIGAKFRLMVPEVIQKVDDFKKVNVAIIAELPSERQLISELFPPPMWELLVIWMGMTTSLNQTYGVNSLEDSGSEGNIQKKYSLLLLLLEFANQALVSGVAHVLYPRFVSI